MGLFDGIEKLITEHGSAAILKERIALVNDQYAAIEKALSNSEIRVKKLESDKQHLELDNFKLKEKIRGLEEQISQAHDKMSLEEVREKILVLVSQNKEITDAEVASAIGVGEQLAIFHLKELEKADFVQARYRRGNDLTGERSRNEWFVTQDGRGYLVSHGFLQ